jgi:hypothetical protein
MVLIDVDCCGTVVWKTAFVLAGSMFLVSGSYAAQWTGDNGATRGDLANSKTNAPLGMDLR